MRKDTKAEDKKGIRIVISAQLPKFTWNRRKENGAELVNHIRSFFTIILI